MSTIHMGELEWSYAQAAKTHGLLKDPEPSLAGVGQFTESPKAVTEEVVAHYIAENARLQRENAQLRANLASKESRLAYMGEENQQLLREREQAPASRHFVSDALYLARELKKVRAELAEAKKDREQLKIIREYYGGPGAPFNRAVKYTGMVLSLRRATNLLNEVRSYLDRLYRKEGYPEAQHLAMRIEETLK